MNKITLSNSVFRLEPGVLRRSFEVFKKEGSISFAKKTLDLLKSSVKRFFKEYLFLKFLYLKSKNGKIIKKIHGNPMILDLNDLGISRELAVYGFHEYNSTSEVKKIITSGMKILEVGANIGYYAILETKLAGENGFLYAFEPSPFNFDLLKKNIELNGIKNAEIHRKAIGAENEMGKFFIANKSNLSSFIKRDDMDMYKNGKIVDVEIIKLDDYLKDKEVDFIRMDVEGYEKEILKGLEITMQTKHPKHFFIEIHSDLLHKKNSSAKEILDYLNKFGYEVIKSFYRGKSEIFADSTDKLLSHPLLEKGYWETFFEYKKKIK